MPRSARALRSGIFALDIASARQYAQAGIRVIALASDAMWLLKATRQALQEARDMNKGLRWGAMAASMALVVAFSGARSGADATQVHGSRHAERGRRLQRRQFRRGALGVPRAAQKGSRLAEFNYAMMLLNGEGGAVDIDEGKEWLRRPPTPT